MPVKNFCVRINGMKRYVLPVIMGLVLFSLSLWSETFECVYLEGEADYLKNGRWFSLDFGTLIDSQTKIRLAAHSSVQLDSPGNSLFFSQEGEYILTAVRTKTAVEQTTAFDKLSQKINRLLNTQKPDATVAMGIRGAEADFDDLGFGTTSREDLDRAWQKIANEDYAGAEADLELYYEMSADPFSEGRLLFSLAYAEEMMGKTGEAWKHLGEIIMPERDDYYPSYLLLSGRISLKAGDNEKAASSFRTFLKEFPDSEAADDARLLLELAEE